MRGTVLVHSPFFLNKSLETRTRHTKFLVGKVGFKIGWGISVEEDVIMRAAGTWHILSEKGCYI